MTCRPSLCCRTREVFRPAAIINWGAGFLPAEHQATTLDTANPEQPIADLFPPDDVPEVKPEADKAGLNFLQKLNRLHRETRRGNSELDARIKAYEMAARLQLSAPKVTDLSKETTATKELYNHRRRRDRPIRPTVFTGKATRAARGAFHSDLLWS